MKMYGRAMAQSVDLQYTSGVLEVNRKGEEQKKQRCSKIGAALRLAAHRHGCN